MNNIESNISFNKEYTLFCFLTANYLAFQVGKLPVYNFVKLNEMNKNSINNKKNWMDHIKTEINFTLNDKLVIDSIQNDQNKLTSFIIEKYGQQTYNIFQNIIE
jgi:hypothetical protein